jgi:hypothetical protein
MRDFIEPGVEISTVSSKHMIDHFRKRMNAMCCFKASATITIATTITKAEHSSWHERERETSSPRGI